METPSNERMNELWAEMLKWPALMRVNMALCLISSAMREMGEAMIDTGRAELDGEYIYLVCGRGEKAKELRDLVTGYVTVYEGRRTLKLGTSGATPLCDPPERN